MGLLVLLNSHKGSEDVALLADDLDLEIDEILPAVEFAEVLQLVKVADGRATFTDLGKKLMSGSIRDRKAIIREQLRKTTLFRTLLRALESAPEHSLSDEELGQIISFTTAPADEAVQNIVNWGRYADLFRYDSSEQRLILTRRSGSGKSGPGSSHPPAAPGSSAEGAGAPSKTNSTSPQSPDARLATLASVAT
jgi:NitT/TauT family transport system ATP-binding protein